MEREGLSDPSSVAAEKEDAVRKQK